MAKVDTKKDFARSYEELAALVSQRLKISLSAKSIGRWRKDPRYKDHWPRPRSGRHHVTAWIEFILRFGLKRADENVGRDELPDERRTIYDWKEDRAKIEYERAVFAFDVEKRKYVLLDEMCAAVGQMLAGFRTAINMLPGNAARWLVGLKDYHAIKAKLDSEVDGVLQALGRCNYMEDVAPAVVEKLFADRTPEFRADLLKGCDQVFIELGRQTLTDLTHESFPESRPAPRIEIS